MTPVQHPLGEHLKTCSGPDNCAEYAAVLAMSPTQHANYINESTARFASLRTARQFRASQQEDYTPPDAFADAIAKRRQAEATPETTFAARYAAERTRELQDEYADAARWTAQQPAPCLMTAEGLKQYEPPNSYQIALDKMRSGSR